MKDIARKIGSLLGRRSQSEFSDIGMYAAAIAGAALRHDFGLHLTSIGRNIAELFDTIDARRDRKSIYYKLPRLEESAHIIDNISERLLDSCVELGEHLRPEAIGRFDERFPTIDKRINEDIGTLLHECNFLEKYVSSINDDEIRTLAKDSINNAERVQLMYSGLHIFFHLQQLDQSEFKPTSLRPMLRKISRAIRIDRAGLHLTEPIPIEGDAEIEAIPAQLSSLFQNLLHNAAKFSSLAEKKEVRIFLNVTTFRELKKDFPLVVYPHNQDGRWLEAHVINNGPPISKEDVNAIFRLYVTKSPSDADFSGSGMGLAIAKLIVTIHGGLIFPVLGRPYTNIVVLLPEKHKMGIDRKTLIKNYSKTA